MKKTACSISLVLLIAGVFLAGAWYGPRGDAKAAAPGARKVLYYVDPMHPTYKSDKPGIAPDCGMELVPVYEDGNVSKAGSSASSPSGSVNISAEKQRLLGVQVHPVEQVSGANTLRLLGRVAPDETRVYRLNAGIDGFIREVSAVTTGSQVTKDQQLATFSAPASVTTIQMYIQAAASTERLRKSIAERSVEAQSGQATLANYQQRVDQMENLGVSALQMEEINRTREVPASIKILAPADGFVLARNVSPGLKFDRGAELYRIADLRRVWILADVFKKEAKQFRPGMQTRVTLPDDPGRVFQARVSDILPQFDPAARTLKVRLEADNPGFALRPDMFVDVELQVTHAPTLAVPADAILDTGIKKTVFIDRGNGLFEPRQVETGERMGDNVEIVKGLKAGDRIVTAGTFLLDSERRMKLAAAGATGHMHAGHAHQAESPTGPASAQKSAPQTHEAHIHPPATGAASETATPPPAQDHSAHQHP